MRVVLRLDEVVVESVGKTERAETPVPLVSRASPTLRN